jgi:hypothetical protein
VLELDGLGGHILLERGELDARVVHSSGAQWDFEAGPFRVHVIGTRFSLSWDPARERFALDLREGAVELFAPTFDGHCVVKAGQSVAVAVRESQVSGPCRSRGVASPGAARPAQPPERDPVTEHLRAAPDPASVVSAKPGSSSDRAPALRARIGGWRQLAIDGDRPAAWQALSGGGFDRAEQSASAEDLLLIADLARFSRAPDRATHALLELRKRFPGSAEASRAAFLLGRIAVDQLGLPLDGARWFETYLQEQPGGSFAEEALGRQLDCYSRAAANEAAERTARLYLALHPSGAYRNLAQRTLGVAQSARGGH